MPKAPGPMRCYPAPIRRAGETGVRWHFEQIGKAIKIPIMVYNIRNSPASTSRRSLCAAAPDR